MNALGLVLRRTPHGWAVHLSDGRELAHFSGPGAEERARRYLARITEAVAGR